MSSDGHRAIVLSDANGASLTETTKGHSVSKCGGSAKFRPRLRCRVAALVLSLALASASCHRPALVPQTAADHAHAACRNLAAVVRGILDNQRADTVLAAIDRARRQAIAAARLDPSDTTLVVAMATIERSLTSNDADAARTAVPMAASECARLGSRVAVTSMPSQRGS